MGNPSVRQVEVEVEVEKNGLRLRLFYSTSTCERSERKP
jgi:hypothetical protein